MDCAIADPVKTLPKLALLLFSLGLPSAFAADTPKPIEFPSLDSARRVSGELVSADFIHRTGQFRSAKGELMDFTMPPYASVNYLNAEADLRDVPLGTVFQFHLNKDAHGGFTRLATMRDQFTADAHPLATERVRTNFIAFTKFRGLPGWVEKTESNRLTVVLFSGDAAGFQKAWMDDFAIGKELHVVVANDELRTWNPPVDRERGTLIEIQQVPVAGYGCSGVRLVFTVRYMLEGFRRGRVVRVFGKGWPAKDQSYGESLMGYGYGRLKTTELLECPPKEYPAQFPFRTDYGNAHLPWFQLKGTNVPPRFAEHLVFGEILKADTTGRTGRFRTDRTGKIVNFTLLTSGSVKHLNADATLADLPPGTRCRFHLFQDHKGAFTRASLVSDEFSHLAASAITYRVESLKLARGRLHVARQIPEVKNYNDDMEQPPDLGRCELRVTAETRVWKGEQQVKLSDLAVGDALLVNLTGELPGKPSRCTDIWIRKSASR